MFTKGYVLSLVEEMNAEEKKTKRVPHYYQRGGKMVERSYPDLVYTERYKELFYDHDKKYLRSDEAKIFKCSECGEIVGYFDLEHWICDFDKDDYTCSSCYEDEMGEDL